MDEVPPGYVAVGRAGAPWGVRGTLRVVPLVDKRQRLDPGRSVTIGGRRRAIESCRWQKGLAYLKLAGIDDRDAAAALRDFFLLVPESELEPLPEGQYYRFQLIGLRVRTASGQTLGEIADVLITGANDVYVVRGASGDILVPATADVIKEVDLQDRRMLIEDVPGLIPEPRRK